MMRLGRYSDGCLCGAVRLTMNAAPKEPAITSIAASITAQSFPQVEIAGMNFCLPQLLAVRAQRRQDRDSCPLPDAPNQLRLSYENWVIRHEDWLPPFDVVRRCQHDCVAAAGAEP
jgi:hypothetical protein